MHLFHLLNYLLDALDGVQVAQIAPTPSVVLSSISTCLSDDTHAGFDKTFNISMGTMHIVKIDNAYGMIIIN